ncbi:lipopolysaccharide biosynthesis protein [Serratia fonticola]|uniref:lipopolysaccharide biosynthesis protein n=1 Tax=Serratia fonticola TaxID=47917 RepID=UPI003BB72590
MRVSKSIVKIFSYLCGDVLNKAIPFLLLPVITSRLSIEQFGIYTTAFLILSFFFSTLSLGLNSKVIIDGVKDKRTIKSSIITAVITITSLFFLMLVLVFTFFEIFNVNSIYGLEIKGFYFVLASAYIQSIFYTVNVKFQINGDVLKFSAQQVFYTICLFVAILYSLYVGDWNDIWRNIFFSHIMILLLSIVILYRDSTSALISKAMIYSTVIFGVYQLPHILSSWVRLAFDRFVVAEKLGMSFVGGYSAVLQLGLIVSVIVTSFNRFWSPYAIRKLRDKESLYRPNLLAALAILLLCFGVSVSGYMFMRFLMPAEYHEFAYLVPIVCLSYAFQGYYFLVVNNIFFFERSYLLAIPSLTSIIIHMLLSPFLVSAWGVLGAAIALLISWFLLFVITYFISSNLKI